MSKKQRTKIRKEFQTHFTDIFLEAVKILGMNPKEAKKRVNIINPELLKQYYLEKKSVIVYAAHIANWEWMAFLPLHIDHRFLSFYQKQSSSYFNELMLLLRQKFGNRCVESANGFKVLKGYADKQIPTLTYVIGDQRPKMNSSIESADFFGIETEFLVGADRMASKLDQVLVYAHMTQSKRGYYEVEYIPIKQDESVVKQYASLLEQNIKAQPGQYLWSHKRWKKQISYD